MTASGSGGFFPYGSASVSAATNGVLFFGFELGGSLVPGFFAPNLGFVKVAKTEIGTDSQLNLLSGGP